MIRTKSSGFERSMIIKMKNNNGAAIRRLSARSLKNNRMRNLFVMMAIVLTSVLFTAVFSLTSGIIQTTQENTMRDLKG